MAKAKTKKAKDIMDKKALGFFEKYINNVAPTSHEWRGQQMWSEYLKPYVDEIRLDDYGTTYGVINPESDYKVVIEAHADEISWMVKYINDEGLIYVVRNGGSDHICAPSKRVNIHTPKGIVKAVFGWPAIHLRGRNGNKEEFPTVNNIYLDCGCHTREEVEALGVHIGCVITYEDEFMTLNDRYFVGRALDNRAGGFMIAQVARLFKENKKKLPFGLYVVNSVMEEVGLRGATMIAENIKPNVAIVTDVAHDTTTPMIKTENYGEYKCGDGPIVSFAPAIHNKLVDLIRKTAEKHKIPHQLEALSRYTGTDTDAFAFSGSGVPSALISLPLRYMHTTVEMVHKEDLQNVVDLMYQSVLNIKYQHDFKYFKV